MPARREIDWEQQPLGLVGDRVLAEQIGVARSTVEKARNKRGIKPAIGRGGPGIQKRRKANVTRCTGCNNLPTPIEYATLLEMVKHYGTEPDELGIIHRDTLKAKWNNAQYQLDPATWPLERFRGQWLCRGCVEKAKSTVVEEMERREHE